MVTPEPAVSWTSEPDEQRGRDWERLGRAGCGADTLLSMRTEELFLSHRPQRLEAGAGGSVLQGVLGPGAVLCCAVARWGRRQHLGPWALSTPFSVPHPPLAFPLHASLLFSQVVSEPQSYRWKPTTDPVVQLPEAFSRGRVPIPTL